MNTQVPSGVLPVRLLLALVLSLVSCSSSGGGGGGGGGGNGGGDGSLLSATPGKGKITLEWPDVAGATSYTLAFTNSDGEGSATRAIAISGTLANVTSPHVHDRLIYGETYNYTLTAIEPDGGTVATGDASGTPDPLPLEEIAFADENMEACVLNSTLAGQQNAGATFAHQIDTLAFYSLDDTEYCGSMSFSGGISAFTGVEYLTSLIVLDLYAGDIADISGFPPLTQLEELNLSVNPISDVSPLASLGNLRFLGLAVMSPEQPLTGVASLVALKKDTAINLANNTDVLPCADLQTLIGAFDSGVVIPGVATPTVNCTNF